MNPDAYNQLMYEANIYKQQLDMIQGEMGKATKTLSEISGARTILRETKNAEEIIMPIGGGVFFKGNTNVDKIILRVGSGYSLAVPREKAVDELEKRETAIKTLIEKFSKESMKIAEQMDRINLELAKYQQQKQ